KNVGTADAGWGKIILSCSPMLSGLIAQPQPDVVTAGRAIWNFTDLQAKEYREIHFSLRADSTALGDTVRLVAQTDSVFMLRDANPVDNFDTLRKRVVNSFDPNEKQSYPDGKIA